MQTVICICLFFTTFTTFANQAPVSEKQISKNTVREIDSFTAAIPINRIPPEYPIQAARDSIEGWVQLSFVIDKNGSVNDVTVLNYEGSRSFILPAKKAVKQWLYTPAKNQYGNSILSCKNSVQLDFRMSDSNEVTALFLDLLKQSFTAIKLNDVKNMESLMEEVDEFEGKIFAEWAWTHYLKMRYFELLQDNKNYTAALKRAAYYVDRKDQIITESAELNILQKLFAYQVENQYYKNAIKSFERIKELNSPYAQKLIAHFQPIMTQINQIVSGNKNILVKGKVKKKHWHHHLIRNKFSISNIQGNLKDLEVRCDNKRDIYTIAPDTAWVIPKSWGQCSIYVAGESGANFDLYELPSDT